MSDGKLGQLRSELESQAEGYLKVVKRLGTRRRYFRLSGAVLYEYVSCEAREEQEPRQLVVWNVQCTNELKREITVAIANRKKLVTVIAYTPDEYIRWKKALSEASKRDIYNKYRVGRQLGSGTFGDVFYGEEKETGMAVAIKRIEKRNNSRYLEREVNVAKSVNHPCVVRTLDIFETSEHLYLILEYMAGGELYDVLAEHGTLSEKAASQVARSILQALAYLHRNGIVHRDLKPENILCKSTEWSQLDVKVADFGLAGLIVASKQQECPEEDEEIVYVKPSRLEGPKKKIPELLGSFLSKKLSGGNGDNPRQRKEELDQTEWHDYDLYAAAENELLRADQTMSSYVGSPAFCAPEVLHKKKYGPPVDSWGVGCILFNILCGEVPFDGDTAKDTMRLVKTAKYEMKEKLWNGISAEAKSFVRGLLQEDPLKRLSAEAALHHPWLAGNGTLLSERPLKHDVSLLHSRRRAVKRTMRGVKAATRMKALSLHLPEFEHFSNHTSGRRSMSLTDQRLLLQISRHIESRE